MIRLPVLILAFMFVGASPTPEISPLPEPEINLDGSELRAMAAACGELPTLVKFTCTSSKMIHFKVRLFCRPCSRSVQSAVPL